VILALHPDRKPSNPPSEDPISGQQMALPEFIIIGAAKAGTTSLHALLEQHPDIYMTRPKEPEFFARDDLYMQGIAEYETLYDAAKPGQLRGEASTIYTLSPIFSQTAKRIHAHVPEAKLIFVMREPVRRAFSYYQQLIKNYQNDTRDQTIAMTFEACIGLEKWNGKAAQFAGFDAHLPDTPELWLAGSEYVTQINAYLEYFPIDQMLFLKFEDFLTNPKGMLEQITEFLEVAPLDESILNSDAAGKNQAEQHFRKAAQVNRIQKLRKAFGPLWSLRKLLPTAQLRRLRQRYAEQVGTAEIRALQPSGLKPETQTMLRNRYRAQIPELERLTKLKFDDWFQD
jgi:hypothetical protein